MLIYSPMRKKSLFELQRKCRVLKRNIQQLPEKIRQLKEECYAAADTTCKLENLKELNKLVAELQKLESILSESALFSENKV